MAVLKMKSHRVWNVLSGRPILFFGLFAALAMIGITVYQAIRMELYFPSTILMLAGAGVLLLALALYLILFQSQKLSKVISWVLILSVCGTNIYFMSGMYSIRAMIESMCAPMVQSPQVMSIYCSKQAPISDLSRLNGLKVGFLQGRNDQGNQQVIDDLSARNIAIQAIFYPNMNALFTALKGQSVSAICLNDYDLDLMDLLDPQALNREAVQLMDSFEYPVNPLYGDPSIDVASQPFTTLIKISGSIKTRMIDDLALAVINPTAKICKIFLIPRDFWISYGCDNGACSFEADKLALAGYFSDGQLASAISMLLGVPVNFIINVSLGTLLDSLSDETLSILNPSAFSSGMTAFEAGEISLNKEQAKLFAGMFDLSGLDRTYMHNAYLILQALWQEYPIESLDLISGELKRLNDSLKTDFSYEQFVHLIETLTYNASTWQFEQQELYGSDQQFYSALLTAETYAQAPEANSINQARSEISAILGLQNEMPQLPAETEQPVQIEEEMEESDLYLEEVPEELEYY